MLRTPDIAYFFDVMTHQKHTIYKNYERPFNLNIVGWRSSTTKVDTFDDCIAVYWPTGNGNWESRSWPATTRPGKPWLLNPMSPKGTAILVPGQYVSAYALGSYRGYTALRQVEPVTVFRDNNKDDRFGLPPTLRETGLFGIHIHRAGVWSSLVSNWSAGCQVFQSQKDFDEFISLCRQAERNWGKFFTYTLLEI